MASSYNTTTLSAWLEFFGILKSCLVIAILYTVKTLACSDRKKSRIVIIKGHFFLEHKSKYLHVQQHYIYMHYLLCKKKREKKYCKIMGCLKKSSQRVMRDPQELLLLSFLPSFLPLWLGLLQEQLQLRLQPALPSTPLQCSLRPMRLLEPLP